MDNVFTIARSNSLRFVNTTNYSQNKLFPNFDNILLADEQWMQSPETIIPYFQKFNQGDQILIQILTNYPEYFAINNFNQALIDYGTFVQASQGMYYPVTDHADFNIQMTAIKNAQGLTNNNFSNFIAIAIPLTYPLTSYFDFVTKWAAAITIIENTQSALMTPMLKAYDYDDNPITLDDSNLQFESVFVFGDNKTQIINIYINTTALLGKMYFKILGGFTDRPFIEFTSELIEIGDYSHMPLIQWTGSRFDGINYNSVKFPTIFGFRVEAAITYAPGNDSVVYKNYDFSQISLRQVPLRFYDIKTDGLPRYINEKLIIASTHDLIYINGLLFTKNGDAKSEWIEVTNLYNFNLSLQEQEYESYFNLANFGGLPSNTAFFSYDGVNSMVYDTSNDKIIPF